ncbi:MAG TPA: zinc-dependent metalloprotease family protein [Candidatus Binatia bacterium]|nr:zinc-dependent metalloprotease family protein [Candidatus Binatia bacterium]
MRIVTLLATAVLVSACGSSTDTGLDSTGAATAPGHYAEEWNGGPFTASNALVTEAPLRACPAQTAGTPVCDYHRITPPAGVTTVAVAIRAAEGFEGDDYDLYVYDDQDNLVAGSASSGSNESTVFPTNGSAWYEVRVQPYTVSLDSGYHGVAAQSDTPVDKEVACDAGALSGENYPEYLGIPGVTDDGQTVELSVSVLLDGIDEQLARDIMAIAKTAYAPLNIDLTLKGVHPVTIHSSVSNEMIDESKSFAGNKPLDGADVQVTMTTKEMQAATGGAGTVLGQADCIGGIRAPYNAFLVATVGPEAPFDVGGFLLSVDQGPETIAHEIGHLMGAHHHYGNCVEGISPEDADRNDISPCDLMFPSVEPLSLTFGTLEAATVRGHAVEFASP